jgi:pimeloyl-ACP methyl ester carboxylesterase
LLIRGLDLHVVDEGSGTPPLLLVHGFTGSDIDWVDVQPALAKGRRTVAYTHRGHGDSQHADRYTFDELVADLVEVIDQLGLAPLHLLGHSMGGIVALRYALEHPERLRSLILMDTFAEPAGGIGRDWMESAKAKVRAEGMASMFELMRGFMADADPDVLARTEHKLTNMDPEAFCAFADELGAYPSMVGRLGELAMPVTVLVGANDGNLVQPAHVMAEAIPGAVLEVIADAGHSPQEDRPDEWLRVVEAHLARATS